MLYTRFRLNSAVSAASNYVVVNACNVNSTGGATLASNAATIVQSSQGSSWANASVVVNNGPTSTINNGTATAGGTAANADSCYCPTFTGGVDHLGHRRHLRRGLRRVGPKAGKFVTITASRDLYAAVLHLRHRAERDDHDKRRRCAPSEARRAASGGWGATAAAPAPSSSPWSSAPSCWSCSGSSSSAACCGRSTPCRRPPSPARAAWAC